VRVGAATRTVDLPRVVLVPRSNIPVIAWYLSATGLLLSVYRSV
jgi:hypothetical protein